MANHKSAKKRAQQNEVRRLRNRSVKTQIKGIVKNVRATAAGEDTAQGPVQLKLAQSAIDKAAKKGVFASQNRRAQDIPSGPTGQNHPGLNSPHTNSARYHQRMATPRCHALFCFKTMR